MDAMDYHARIMLRFLVISVIIVGVISAFVL